MRKLVKEQALGKIANSIDDHDRDSSSTTTVCVSTRSDVPSEHNQIGMVTGLAWTQVGGELLNIEAVAVPGKGQQTKTGSLGDVMQESIQAALTFVRSRSRTSGNSTRTSTRTHDMHIHVPEGATPKDGPSAGIGMCTAIVSVLTGIPVRADVAMTGEITLRGQVLPIGGLKEKLLAAHRGGIRDRDHSRRERTRSEGNSRQHQARSGHSSGEMDGRSAGDRARANARADCRSRCRTDCRECKRESVSVPAPTVSIAHTDTRNNALLRVNTRAVSLTVIFVELV